MQLAQIQSSTRHGAEVTDSGVAYRWWSPEARNVAVLVRREQSEKVYRVELSSQADGWFSGFDSSGNAGDCYELLVDNKIKLPDVASRFQPGGVKGPSQVIDPRSFSWSDASWKCPDPTDLVIYELHVGTFTSAGTFVEALNQFQHIRQLGANAIELMPISAFPGDRNWGYDVVLHFAPANSYGNPDDLRRLIDAAHRHGLAVIIDVVYNHVCGEPNYLKATSVDYFRTAGGNAWGSSLNFDGKNSAAVRAFFLQNAAYWLDEFHADGLRLDATHAIEDESEVHILREITETVHRRGGFVIAEDERNDARLIRSAKDGGFGMDAAWADDFHHVVKMALKPEPIGHFKSYQGTLNELRDTLENGWLFRGQHFLHSKKPRGTDCRDRPAEQFIYCISNHDQAGNRPLGERLNQLVSAEAYRATSMFFLLTPYTPMLFMGQEWAASTPFVFFTNHTGNFGAMVSKGRLNEFQHFGSQWPDEMLLAMPDPENSDAFLRSKLNWHERDEPAHGEVLALYRECLRRRADDPVLRQRARDQWKVWVDGNLLFLRYGIIKGPSRLLVGHLKCGDDSVVTSTVELGWKIILSSNDRRFGGKEAGAMDEDENRLTLRGAETILLGNDL